MSDSGQSELSILQTTTRNEVTLPPDFKYYNIKSFEELLDLGLDVFNDEHAVIILNGLTTGVSTKGWSNNETRIPPIQGTLVLDTAMISEGTVITANQVLAFDTTIQEGGTLKITGTYPDGTPRLRTMSDPTITIGGREGGKVIGPNGILTHEQLNQIVELSSKPLTSSDFPGVNFPQDPTNGHGVTTLKTFIRTMEQQPSAPSANLLKPGR